MPQHLTFPTQAEKAIAAFKATVTQKSLAAICERRGAERLSQWPAIIEYTFDDDSVVRISGRGRNHKYEALLP